MRKLATAVLAAINCFLFSIAVSAAPYVVKAGDTMWLIAKTHGMTIEELILANPDITDPSNIWPGLTLNIPDENTPDDENGNYASEGKESLTFLYAGNTVSYLKIIDTAQNSLNTICPDYFDIDANGNLWITPSNKIDPEFIANIHERRIRITPFISNHWDKAKGNAALNNMEALTDQIANAIDVYNLDGVNIDIENVSEEYRNAYSKFTRLLRGKLPANKIVSVAAAANPNGWNTGWHGSYDYKALSDYSDYLMIMAYDESYAGGSAGPISSKAFFENSIKYALNKGVPKEKIVVGIPFFGRYWKAGDAVGGNAVTASDVEFLTANYESVKRYDTARESANVTVTIKPGEPEPKLWGGRILTAGVYDIWYDDLHAVKFKLDLIRQYGVKGAGSWALGQENTEMWRYYLDALNGGSTATPTATITPTPTNTFTPTPTVSITPTPTNTFTPTPANTLTPTPTVSITLTPTVSITPTPTATITPMPTNTFTPTPTNTLTPFPTNTLTPVNTPSLAPPSPTSGPDQPVGRALSRILKILNKDGDPRTVTAQTVLTRGETAVLLAKWTYVAPEWDGPYSFDDITDHWSSGYINALYRRGILFENSPYFFPDRNIRKDELCVYLERLLVLPDAIDFHGITFIDVPMSSFAYNAISKLCFFNVVSGENQRLFRPEANITAYDMSVILEMIEKYEYSVNPNRPMERSRGKRSEPVNPEKNAPYIEPE